MSVGLLDPKSERSKQQLWVGLHPDSAGLRRSEERAAVVRDDGRLPQRIDNQRQLQK